MTEMRECWRNVYRDSISKLPLLGAVCRSREEAIICDAGFATRAFYRLHIRLKPPGAPKRYRNQVHRLSWERDPNCAKSWEIYYKTRERLA